jgi:hypothetical protein
MDPGSSGDEDSDDVPLSVAAAALAPSSRGIPVLSGHSKPKPVAPAAASAVPKPANPSKPTKATGAAPSGSKPVKRPLPAKPHNNPAKRPANAGASSSKKVVPASRPKSKSKDSESSSDDDESDASISDEGSDSDPSSEADDASDDEGGRPQPIVAVGIPVSSRARLALERLREVTKHIDANSAPLGTQSKLSGALDALGACQPIKSVCEGGMKSLDESNANDLIERLSTAVANLAGVVSSSQSVDLEVDAFRRVSHQIHGVWDTTLPQIEALEAAVRESQESSARAARVAAELLGSHMALAGSVASSLEGLLDR